MIKAVAKRIRPLHVLSSVLLYALGVGISDYLGVAINIQTYILGQAWVLSLQLGMYYLGDYLGIPLELGVRDRPPFGSPKKGDQELLQPEVILSLSALLLALWAAFTVILFQLGSLSGASLFLMAAFFTAYLIRLVPDFSLLDAGYGEFLTTLQIVVIVPALGFMLQAGESHRLLGLTVFPLFALHLAMLLAFQFPSYASDITHDRVSMLTKMGWKNGIFVHNILILLAYLILGFSLFFGFPSHFVVPVLFTLPLGAFQVWYVYSLSQGAPTRWKRMLFLSITLFFLPAYLFAYTYWTR